MSDLSYIVENLRPLAVPIDSCRPDPSNARKGHDIDVIAASLNVYNQRKPIVVNRSENMKIEAGNGTWQAAKQLGWTHIAAVIVEDDPVTAVGYGIADNRSNELSEWDDETLATLLSALDLEETVTGFTADDLEEILAELGQGLEDGAAGDAEPQTSRAEALQAEWGTAVGQLWAIGGHRLICGDCTDAATVERVMGGEKVDLVLTDPPYMSTDLDFDKTGVSWSWVGLALDYTAKNGYLAQTGTIETLAQTTPFWSPRFSGVWLKEKGGMRTATAKKPMSQSEPYMVYANPAHDISGLVWNNVLIEGEPYTKVQKLKGYQRGGKDQLDRSNTKSWTQDGYVCENDGFRYQTDVLFASAKSSMKHDERTIHPTQKPLDLFNVFIQWLTNPSMLVYEPFAGSGTTLVACQNLNRRCRAVEISPAYCGVILQRMRDAFPDIEIKLLEERP